MRWLITNEGGTFDALATCAYGPERSKIRRTLSAAYSGLIVSDLVFHDELVEVPEVRADVVVAERRVATKDAVRLERGAELRDVVLEDHRPDELLEQRDLVGLVALHQSEVEEGHDTVAVEQVVARVRVAVERVEAVQAPEHEAEDRLGREVAFLL